MSKRSIGQVIAACCFMVVLASCAGSVEQISAPADSSTTVSSAAGRPLSSPITNSVPIAPSTPAVSATGVAEATVPQSVAAPDTPTSEPTSPTKIGSSAAVGDPVATDCPLSIEDVTSLYGTPMQPEAGPGRSAAVTHETIDGITSQSCTYLATDSSVQVGLRLEFRLGDSADRSWELLGSTYPSALFKAKQSELGEVYQTLDADGTAQETSLVVHRPSRVVFVTSTGYGVTVAPGVVTTRAEKAAQATLTALEKY